jgi:hypothetical protein
MKRILLFLCALLALPLAAQTVLGHITNEFNEPVPYANVLVQELGTGTTSDDQGYYELNLNLEGNYRLVFSSLGYTSNKSSVIVGLDTVELNIRLETSGVELNEITVNASKRDPAYGIMKKVSDNRTLHLRSAPPSRSKVYVKAVEEIERTARKPAPEPEETDEGGVAKRTPRPSQPAGDGSTAQLSATAQLQRRADGLPGLRECPGPVRAPLRRNRLQLLPEHGVADRHR